MTLPEQSEPIVPFLQPHGIDDGMQPITPGISPTTPSRPFGDPLSTYLREGKNEAPINGLPIETLLAIFDKVLESIPHETYYRHLLALSEVCSLWNQVINNTPRLWSIISLSYNDLVVSYNTRLVRRAITTSKQVLLDVYVKLWLQVTNPEMSYSEVHPRQRQLLGDILDETSHRWRLASFQIANGAWMARIIGAASNSASSLERLQLTLDRTAAIDLDETAFPISIEPMPQLQFLSFTCGLLRIPPDGLRNVRSLRMSSPPRHVKYTSTEWRVMLSGLPNLVELEVVGDMEVTQHDTTKALEGIEMPSLEVILLSSGYTVVGITLQSISAPACRILRVELDHHERGDDYPISTFYEALASHAAVVAQSIAKMSGGSVLVVSKPEELHFLPLDGPKDCIMTFHYGFWDHGGIEPFQILEEAISTGFDGNRVTLVLPGGVFNHHLQDMEGGVVLAWHNTVVRCLTTWSSLNVLWCGTQSVLVEDLLRKLATASNLTGALPCPSLQEITIDCDHFVHSVPANSIASFLSIRHEQMHQHQLLAPTSPLKEFRMTRASIWSQRERQDLQAVLDRTGVHFEEGPDLTRESLASEPPRPSLSLQAPIERLI